MMELPKDNYTLTMIGLNEALQYACQNVEEITCGIKYRRDPLPDNELAELEMELNKAMGMVELIKQWKKDRVI